MTKNNLLLAVILLIISLSFTGYVMASEIHEAAKKGDLTTVKNILVKDATRLHAQDHVGYTPLHWAAVRGKWDVFKYLLDAGAEVNIQGLDRCPVLFSACNHDQPDIISLLLEKGAKMEVKNAWGNTPLCLAAEKGHAKVVSLLISKGADINAASNENWTPLHYARKADHQDVVDILLKAGASTTIKDNFGKTAMEYNYKRPTPIELETSKLNDYVGEYTLPGGFYFKVWVENDHLWFEDYSHECLYPISVDSFHTEKHPWIISFSRNNKGEVDSIYVGFQRQTLVAEKDREVKNREEKKPKIGILSENVSSASLSEKDRKVAFSDVTPDSMVVSVIVVIENTPADIAGIRPGDIILNFNNVKVASVEEFKRQIAEGVSGVEIPMEILRKGEILKVAVVLN